MTLNFFYLFAFFAVFSSLLMITRRNPVVSAIYLVFAFFCFAGLYVLLKAHFVAALQVLIYAGAIVVLVLFVIMLLNLGELGYGGHRHLFVRSLGAALSIILLGYVLRLVGRGAVAPFPDVPRDFGTVERVGEELYTRFVLPFEITSIMLLAAIVGAVILAKREVR